MNIGIRKRKIKKMSKIAEVLEAAKSAEEMLEAFKKMEGNLDERDIGLDCMIIGIQLDKKGNILFYILVDLSGHWIGVQRQNKEQNLIQSMSLILLRKLPCLGVRDSSSIELPSHSTRWLSTCLNIANEKMEMITPIGTCKFTSGGEKMEMTTPVITTRNVMGKVKEQNDQDSAEKTHLSQERPGMDSNNSYGMLGINNDLNESPP